MATDFSEGDLVCEPVNLVLFEAERKRYAVNGSAKGAGFPPIGDSRCASGERFRRTVMTNADWWARVVQARTHHADLLPQRVWTLRKSAPRSCW